MIVTFSIAILCTRLQMFMDVSDSALVFCWPTEDHQLGMLLILNMLFKYLFAAFTILSCWGCQFM